MSEGLGPHFTADLPAVFSCSDPHLCPLLGLPSSATGWAAATTEISSLGPEAGSMRSRCGQRWLLLGEGGKAPPQAPLLTSCVDGCLHVFLLCPLCPNLLSL